MKISIKFFVVILLIIAVGIYNYYMVKTSNEAIDFKVKNLDFNSFSERHSKIQKRCKEKDPCYLAVYYVDMFEKFIKLYKLDKTVQMFKTTPGLLRVSSNDYYLIDTRGSKSPQVKFHTKAEYLGKSTKVITRQLKKQCPSDVEAKLCNFSKVTNTLIEYADTNKHGGFVEYPWYSLSEGLEVVKRSYVKKLEEGVYAISEFKVRVKEANFRLNIFVVYVLNIVLFILFWEMLEIDFHVNSKLLSNLFYITIVGIFFFNFIRINKREEMSIDEAEREYKFTLDVGMGITSLTLALALFLSRLMNPDNRTLVKNMIVFLSLSIAFILLAFIEFGTEKTYKSVTLKTEIKHNFITNSLAFFMVAIMYMYTQSTSEVQFSLDALSPFKFF